MNELEVIKQKLKEIRAFLQGLAYNKDELDDAKHYENQVRLVQISVDTLIRDEWKKSLKKRGAKK